MYFEVEFVSMNNCHFFYLTVDGFCSFWQVLLFNCMPKRDPASLLQPVVKTFMQNGESLMDDYLCN